MPKQIERRYRPVSLSDDTGRCCCAGVARRGLTRVCALISGPPVPHPLPASGLRLIPIPIAVRDTVERRPARCPSRARSGAARPVPRPQEHVQRSTNGGDERSTAVTLLLSKFSSVDLRSTDVTLFT